MQPVHGAGRLSDGEDEQIARRPSRPGARRAAGAAPPPRGAQRSRATTSRRSRSCGPSHERDRAPPRSPRRAARSTTMRPPYITATRSESASTSESSADTSRIAVPASRAARRRVVDELDRADVDAARGLRRDEHRPCRARARARSRSSAGCRPTARARGARGRPGECQRARCAARASREHARAIERAATGRYRRCRPRMRLSAMRVVEHEPAAVTVLGNVREAERVALAHRERGRRRDHAMRISPLVARRRPTIASMSSLWPLPSTPAMPRISPARHGERHIVHRALASLARDDEVAHLEPAAGCARHGGPREAPARPTRARRRGPPLRARSTPGSYPRWESAPPCVPRARR